MDIDYYLVRITTEEALKNTFQCFSGNYFVFRGQTDSSWTLKTLLERNIESLKLSSSNIGEYETRLIKDYMNNKKTEFNPIEIISDIQHYGGATRLIDFTHNYKVALFFAFCDFPKDFSTVWAISKNNLPFIGDYQIQEHHGELSLFDIDFQQQYEENRLFDFYIEEFVYSETQSIQDFINEKMKNYPNEMREYKIGALDILSSKELEYNLEYKGNFEDLNAREKFVEESMKNYLKKMKNQRIIKQEGLHLFSSNLNHTFEENLFFGKTMKKIEEDASVIIDPEYEQLNSITADAYKSQRGVIKFEIISSLTKVILEILEKGSYEISFPNIWSDSGNPEIEKYDFPPITFITMYPDDFGFYRDLTHKLLD